MIGLTACATSGSPEVSPQAQPALALAQLLEDTAIAHPDRIVAAQDEMQALQTVLLYAPAAPVMADASPVPTPEMAVFEPAPDLTGAHSLMHGVHLASYQRHEHALVGWTQLQTQLPALTALAPRLESVALPQGEFLRLKAGPLDQQAQAQALCAQAEAAGLWCQVTHFTGDPLSSSHP